MEPTFITNTQPCCNISSLSISNISACINSPMLSYSRSCWLVVLIIANIVFNQKHKLTQKTVPPLNHRKWLRIASIFLAVFMVSMHHLFTIKDYSSQKSPSSFNMPQNAFQFVNSQIFSNYMICYSIVLALMVSDTGGFIDSKLTITFFWLGEVVFNIIKISESPYPPTVSMNSYEISYLLLLNLCLTLLQIVVLGIWGIPLLQKLKSRLIKKEEIDSNAAFGWRGNWLSKFTLHWTWGVVIKGMNTILKVTDLPDLHSTEVSSSAFEKFDSVWNEEKQSTLLEFQKRTKEQQKVPETSGTGQTSKEDISSEIRNTISLNSVLIKSFGSKFFLLHGLMVCIKMGRFIDAYLFKEFLDFIQTRSDEPLQNGVLILLAILVFNILKTTSFHCLNLEIIHYQRYIESSMSLAIFKKSLTIKNHCMKEVTTAEIVNLISYECERISRMGKRAFMVVTEPLVICISMFMLYNQIGNAMWIGVLIMVLLTPFNAFLGNKVKENRIKKNKLNESRTTLMNEIITGIKALKLYAWEPYFISKVKEIRKVQEEENKSFITVIAFCDFLFKSIPFIVKLCAFGTFLILGGHINAANGFMTMHLFRILNYPFAFIAMFTPGFIEAGISLKKVNKYLNGDDIPENIVNRVKDIKGTIDTSVVIKNGSFSWDTDESELLPTETLKSIELDIRKGGLVAVIGMVGCGKSSLLSAILGEMEKLKGYVEIKGQVAYVPQEAWILNKTLKENILFGSSENKDFYCQTINACALQEDINSMTDGDSSVIGEKGINLSGGQKQRISLARAVYSDVDVYLLDDPLSAVDAHVGRHIFKEVIGPNGILKEKTRVVVTHGVHWLPYFDSIIVVKDGAISMTGSYENLMKEKEEFRSFIRHVLSATTDSNAGKFKKERQDIMMRLSSYEKDDNSCKKNKMDVDENSSSESDSENQESFNFKDRNHCNSDNEKPKKKIEDAVVEKYENNVQKVESVYFQYARAVGFKSITTFGFIYAFKTFLSFSNSQVIKYWTDSEIVNNISGSVDERLYNQTNWNFYYMFATTGALDVFVSFLYVIVILRAAFKASNHLHDTLLYRILRCPMMFFNTTPTAMIVGLFSKDVPKIDGFGELLRYLIVHIFDICSYLVIIIFLCPVICFALVPLSIAQYFSFKLHAKSQYQLRQLRSENRSPVFAHFMESLNGKHSIRAYGCQQRFIDIMENKVDTLLKLENWENSIRLAMGTRSMVMHHLLKFSIALVCASNPAISPGLAGLITFYSGEFCDNLVGMFHLLADIEMEIVALEKIIEYSNKPSEAPWEIPENKPPENWPNGGTVGFTNYRAKYQVCSDLVLKGIDCQIKDGQKIGVVGRTGAGKTSLVMSLFRILEANAGKIEICNRNIADMGLHDLRSKINILPQEPIIFKGSLKMNIDPAGCFTDEEIWEALGHAHLKSFVENVNGNLKFQCEESGKNLSVGQKQLLCLARTLLRKNKILVLDEATAAVDMKTDKIIQNTIRNEFKECTVISIAHRLNTIMDYDKIMVLDCGLVAEFDTPQHLLADENSRFYNMVKEGDLHTKGGDEKQKI